MPVRASRSSQFDAAIAGLEKISGAGTAYYIANHKWRCVDDALRLARMVPAGGRILNVGGRPYLFEYIARELGLDVVTLDIDPARNPAECADLGLEVIAADIETAEGREKADLGSYDIVCLAEIFEHMRIDLFATFRHLAFAMRPDARLYLSTPNFHYAPRLLKMLATWRSGPSLVGEWSKLAAVGHMGHVREYARGELVEFFEAAGFRVEDSFVRNSNAIDLAGGGWKQYPLRLLARWLSGRFDRFGEELVFVLVPAGVPGSGR